MLSVQTNFASMVAQSSVNHNNSLLSTAMERLSTGLRINHQLFPIKKYFLTNQLYKIHIVVNFCKLLISTHHFDDDFTNTA